MMIQSPALRRLAAIGLAAVMSLALAACFVMPGKFASSLDLRKDGRFTYAYKGEIFLFGLSKLAQMGQSAEGEFAPSTCYADDSESTERDCTKDEIAQQRAEWEDSRKAAADKRKKDAEEMKAVLGGIDPTDPKAAEELAARLRRQAGWKSVIYKGDGIYDVDFAISGHLDYDFNFPTMERMPSFTSFVVANRRADGTVRIEAPAFAAGAGGGAMSGLGALAAMSGKGDDNKDVPNLPTLDGTFTLTTDGQILTNNTDEGPLKDAAGQKLSWTISPRTTAAPVALIKLGN
mgnify:CR=1 FL=1